MGVLHRAVPNHKFNQIFLKEWRIARNYHPEYSPHRTNFCSKFQVALTPSRKMLPKVQAVQNNTSLENSWKCRWSFVSVRNLLKSEEFRQISLTGVRITFAQYCMELPTKYFEESWGFNNLFRKATHSHFLSGYNELDHFTLNAYWVYLAVQSFLFFLFFLQFFYSSLN